MLDLISALRHRRMTPVHQLLFAQLMMFSGIAAIFPVVPLYVARRGGTSVDIVIFVAGPMIANTLMQLPAGHLVDRIGRKPVLIGSRLVFAAASLGLFLDIGPLWGLATLRCIQGASGGAYVPALRAALADVTPADRRGTVYSQLQAVEMVGLLIGPTLGGTVALWHDSAIFACSGVGVLLGISTLFRFKETHREAADDAVAAASGWWRTRGILIPALGLAAMGSMFSMYDVVWPQYLNVRGYSTFIIGLSESLYAIPILLLAGLAGRISDRGNRRLLVGLSMMLVAACSLAYPGLRDLTPILLVGCVEAVAFVVIEPSLFATISETTNADVRGRAMGIGGLFQFGGSAAGAALLGTLYGVDQALPFRGGATVCIIIGLVCILALPTRRLSHDPQPMAAAIDLESRS